ncbi:hypothetical protein BV898_19580 [Hypsibius exemplaris]|uniref:Transmembrane protein 70-like protein, mitochondrial n=1 Tax=Hypsibius exemplaris TaxID=2072580 RepID=A0A9X6RPK7_HYPEX|nr:hypothetical protein BV898_19580 [Hypsibius exemplaris]
MPLLQFGRSSASHLSRSLLISCPRCIASPTSSHSLIARLSWERMDKSQSTVPKRLPSDFALRSTVPADEKRFGDLVYTGTIRNHLYATKLVSLTSSVVGVVVQPLLFQRIQHLPGFLQGIIGTFFGFFVFVTPILLHQLVRRYVVRMYFNPEADRFTAVTMHFIPRMRNFYTFSPLDVEIPPIPGMFTSFTVQQGEKKVPLFVNPPDFTSDFAYIKLMRYDEPMDIIQGADQKRPEVKEQIPAPVKPRKNFKL